MSKRIKKIDEDEHHPNRETEPNKTEIHTHNEHMGLHGVLPPERDELMEELKKKMDSRNQHIKTKNKINNQVLAMKRGVDKPNPEDVECIDKQIKLSQKMIRRYDKEITKIINTLAKIDKLVGYAMKVKGIGPITVAAMLVYVDLEKAPHISSLWAYAGIDRSTRERYAPTKDQKAEIMSKRKNRGLGFYNSTESIPTGYGGNKTLRCILYNMATVSVKHRTPYRTYVYDREIAKLEKSSLITKTTLKGGKVVEKAWKDVAKGHRQGAALRKVMKMFLAHWWLVGRTLKGLSVTQPYAADKLGHKNILTPDLFGWETESEAASKP